MGGYPSILVGSVSVCHFKINEQTYSRPRLRESTYHLGHLDGLIESISKEERIVLGADLNGHVGKGNIGDEEIMGRYGAGTRNKEGSMVVDFGKRMDLAIVNTYLKKKDEHRVTYKSGGKSTQVDYVM